MMHAADGWGAGMWSSSPCMTSAMVQNYFGKPLPFDCVPPLPSPPIEGVRDKWNENAKRETAGCDESGLLPELELLVIPHMEIYDSHLYLPHGDLGALTKRYEEITIPNKEAARTLSPLAWLGRSLALPEPHPRGGAYPPPRPSPTRGEGGIIKPSPLVGEGWVGGEGRQSHQNLTLCQAV